MSLPKRYVAGADPGKHGAIVLLSTAYNPVRIAADDIIQIPVKRDKSGKLDTLLIWQSLRAFAPYIDLYMQEDVHALYGSSAVGTFEFGDANGALRTVLQLLSLCNSNGAAPVRSVSPKIWQKYAWKPQHIVYTKGEDTKSRKKKDTKATSMAAAKDLFPGVSFVPKRARVPHDGLIDAALIAHYALLSIRGQVSDQ